MKHILCNVAVDLTQLKRLEFAPKSFGTIQSKFDPKNVKIHESVHKDCLFRVTATNSLSPSNLNIFIVVTNSTTLYCPSATEVSQILGISNGAAPAHRLGL